MDDGTTAPDARDPGPRPASGSARARLAAAVGDDVRAPGPLPPGTPPAPVEPLPQLPPDDGLEPVRRLGGSSWLVREVRSGELFVLRPCSAAAGAEPTASRNALRALAVDLADREHPHLVAVRGLLGPAVEPVGLVEDFLAGGSLAGRLAEHGRLAPQEAAAVLRDAAAGLAALHGLGRCHGRLTARQILFRGTGDGPLPAAVRAGTAAGSPPDDVLALGTLGWTALTGRAPAPGRRRVPLARLCPDAPPGLLHAVEAALAADPAERPSAAQLAAGLGTPPRPGPPSPDPSGAEEVRERGPVRASRRRPVLLVAAIVLPLAVGTAALRASHDPAAPPVVPGRPAVESAPPQAAATTRPAPAGPGSPDATVPGRPEEALRVLVARRGEALRAGDAQLLEQVYVPGAEAGAADRVTLERAARTGDPVFADLALEVEQVRGTDPPPGLTEEGGVAFVADVRVEGYRGEPGTAPAVVAAGEGWVQTVVAVLVREQDGWRLAAVQSAREAGAEHAPEQESPRR